MYNQREPLIFIYMPTLLNLLLFFIFYFFILLSFVGDEILEVNGESLQGLTHQQAIQTFKVECIFLMASAKRWHFSIKFEHNRM